MTCSYRTSSNTNTVDMREISDRVGNNKGKVKRKNVLQSSGFKVDSKLADLTDIARGDPDY